MRLRGLLLKTPVALALTALLAVQTMGASMKSKSGQEQPPNTAQPQPAVHGLNGASSYEGQRVAEIHFPNVVQPDDQRRFLALVAQRPGEPLDRDKIRQSIQALYATGRFADIRVEADHGDGGVRLSFLTDPNYFIGDITVEGAPNRPTVGQISNALKMQLGELFTNDKLARGLKNIRQLLEENGYYRYTLKEEEYRNPENQQINIVLSLTPGPHARVGNVSVKGNSEFSEGQIKDIAHFHPGDPVSSQRVTAGLERIKKKYQKQNRWLSQVAISERTYRSDADVVDYTIQVDPGPSVEIVTEGFKISRGEMKRIIPVYQENALDDDLLNEGRRNLLNYLQGKGYFEAKVDLRRRRASQGREMRVVYAIDPGARHKLVRISVVGNQYFPTELLRSHMQVLPSSHLFSSGRYSPRLLEDDISGLEGLYRANGFREVNITSTVEDDYQGRENDLAITVHVNEGPQTRVAALHIVGEQKFPEDQLPYINTAEGQPFSDFYVGQDREIILNYYFNRGFPDATFEAAAKPFPDDPNKMDVTYTIHEGRQVFVDDVLVSGLDYTRPFIVQRELQVKPHDPLSQIEMLNTQQRLYELGIFSQVDTAVQNPEGKESEKNVLVEVQEAKRYTFNYGLGLEFQTGQPTVGGVQPQGATGVSPRVSFDVTRLNFRGRDHTISFKTHVGRLQQRALVSYDAPRWFNSRSLRLSITAFYDNTLDVTTFTSERLEGSVQVEQIVSKASTMTYRMTYRRVQATNLAISSDQIPLLSQPVRVGIPGFSYIRDKRDNALDPTKGNYTTVDGGVASGYFGSEADFGRFLIQNSTYHAFGKNRPAERKFVFARSTRIGVESPFAQTTNVAPGQSVPVGQTVIPLPERFFSGGGNSHRGFGLNQAGPRDAQSGFPLGGSALFLNNLELRFPPVTMPFVQDNVSFAIFHDAGNVFVNANDMLNNLLRWKQKNPELCLQESTASQCDYSYISHAVGVGIRYRTPIGPVRFDFGYNLNPPAFPGVHASDDPNNPGQQITTFAPQHARRFNVYFSIGQTF